MADWLKKQVVVVVEDTAAFRPYWPTILNDHLNNLIRSFSQNESSSSSSEEVAAADCPPSVEFAIVVFNACGSSSSKNIDFSSSSSSDAPDFSAIAQGLAQALRMLRSSNESQKQRHCIVVAATNPNPPHPDVEEVTMLLLQSNVRLSVLFPLWQLKIFGPISNAGKHNPSIAAAAADTGVETVTETLHHMGLSDSDGNSNYVKVWQGDLITTVSDGKRMPITILKAYLHQSVSKFVKDWPSYLHIDFVLRPRNMERVQKKYAEMSHLVLFHAMWSHRLLKDLQRHDDYCGIIQLPSQLLFFTVTNDPSRFLGIILNNTPEQQQILLNKMKVGHAWRRSTDRVQVS